MTRQVLMTSLKCLTLAAVTAMFLTVSAPKMQAQVAVSIGPEPACPYGYYDYPPYACAPYGYYGPNWFVDGVFIGAGPWFHGPAHFVGHVNNHFDVHHGYHGALPRRGEQRSAANNIQHMNNFRGNEMRDGRGHTVSGHQARR